MGSGILSGMGGMTLHWELPVNRRTLALMAGDTAFAALFMGAYGMSAVGGAVSLYLSHPSIVLLACLFPVSLYVSEMYDLKKKWLTPPLWFKAFLIVGAATAVFGLFHHLVCGPELNRLFLVVPLAMTVEVVVVRNAAILGARRERPSRKAIVVGAGWSGRLIIDTVLREPRLGISVVGIIDDSIQKRNFTYKSVPVLGNRHLLRDCVDREGVRLIVVAISQAQNAELIKILLSLKMRGVEVIDMPEFYERVTGQIPIKHVEDSWFLYTGGFDILHKYFIQKTKRCIDVALATVGIVLSLPLMVIVGILVKLDSRGPVFYRQERMGQHEIPFFLMKFRSMRHGAESASGPVWASPGDYRITRIGRWLRLTRLDEIPQFLNVLKGDMSFVGPRPERPFFVQKLKEVIPYYSFRFTVKPGLTGWAQVNYHYGASTEDAIEKLKYDLYYIKNMSFGIDLFIILKTFQVVLFARGA